MEQILFKSDLGVVFTKKVFKNGNAHVVLKYNTSTLRKYIYKDTPSFSSPYISWENLNCCGGWEFNADYLWTAVQCGKKLCAGFYYNKLENLRAGFGYSLDDERLKKSFKICDDEEIEKFFKGLDHSIKYRQYETVNGDFIDYHVDIVRTGNLADFYDINDVIDFYDNQGILLSFHELDEYFNIELLDLIEYKMSYYNPVGIIELVVTGLLLGYPLESTASIIMGH